MSKPTLVQSILNLPSQSYTNPHNLADNAARAHNGSPMHHAHNHADPTRPVKKDYYSTKQEMIRIAATMAQESNTIPRGPTAATPVPAPAGTRRPEAIIHSSSSPKPHHYSRPPKAPPAKSPSYSEDDDDDEDEDSDIDDAFFTPNTSPRTSMASSAATIRFPTSRKPSRRSLTSSISGPDSHQPLHVPDTAEHPLPDSKGSAGSSTVSTTTGAAVPSTRTPSTSNSRARHVLSTSSSLSSNSLEAHSVFSDDVGSAQSTLLSSPHQNDSNQSKAQAGTAKSTTTTSSKRKSSTPADQSKMAVSPSTYSPSSASKSHQVFDKSESFSSRKTSSDPLKSASTSGTATSSIPSTTGSTSNKGKEKEKSDKDGDTNGYGTVTIIASHSSSTTSRANKKYAPPKQPHTFSAFASVSSPEASEAPTATKTSTSATTTPTHSRSSSASAATHGASTKSVPNGNSIPTQTSQSRRISASKSTQNSSASSPTSQAQVTAQKSGKFSSASPPSRASKPLPTSSTSTSKASPVPDAKPTANSHSTSTPPKPTATSPSTITQRKRPTVPRPLPSGMIAMDALMEEDEEGALTPRMESKDLSESDSPGGGAGSKGKRTGGWNWGGELDKFSSETGTSTPPSGLDSGSGSERPSRGLRHTSPHTSDMRRRRSRSLDGTESSSASSTSTARKSKSTRPPPQTLSAEVQALVSDFVSPADRRPSKGTQGYTSLVLPRAPPPSSSSSKGIKKGKGEGWLGLGGLGPDGKIDLTKTGMAKTTMASVEVVRGLGSGVGGGIFGIFGLGSGRRRAWSAGERERDKRTRGPAPLPLPIPPPFKDSGAGSSAKGTENGVTVPSATNTSLAGSSTSTILGFTTYRKPPNYVPSGSVLVQVWAVGVDGVDARLVGVRFGGGYDAGRRDAEGEKEEEEEEERHGGVEQETQRQNKDRNQAESEAEERVRHEREAAEADEEEEDEGDDLQMQSTSTASPTKKGGLAALGRTLSLRLGRNNSTSTKGRDKQADRSRSASAAAIHPEASPSPKERQKPDPFKQAQQNGHANANMRGARTPTSQEPNSKLKSKSKEHKRSLSFTLTLKRNNSAALQPISAPSGNSVSSTTASDINSSENLRHNNAKGNNKPLPKPGQTPNQTQSLSPNQGRSQTKKLRRPTKQTQAEVGYIPGRSFVGRVLEVGWDVRDEVVRKGEWVVGLLDVRKAGALTEFIVVDRHRVHRVPYPWEGPSSSTSPGGKSLQEQRMLTLEELALLPLCGLPAYRAVRTFMYAYSSSSKRDGSSPSTPSSPDRRGLDFPPPPTRKGSLSRGTSDHGAGYRRRALVLRGHDGAGAMAVQMLVRRGWRVSVHVPFSSIPANASQEMGDRFMHVVEERAREWGADEVIFDDGEEGGGPDDGRGAAVRVLDTLKEDGDVFDAVLDTIGGKEIREAAERLLRSNDAVQDGSGRQKKRAVGQFTTLVGDNPERTIPSAGDNFRAGLRSLRPAGGASNMSAGGNKRLDTSEDQQLPSLTRSSSIGSTARVGYAWVSVAQDVDWEGDDVSETLGMALRLALEDGVRPLVEDMLSANPNPNGAEEQGLISMPRAVPFERAPAVFVDNGPLRDGGTVVVRIAQ